MTILFPQQRRFKGLQWRPLRASHWRGMMRRLFSCQFSCRWPRCGDAEQIPQLLTVTGHHDNFLAATRGPNIEQLLLHRIGGEDYRVHCLSLTAMRGNRITVIELMVIHGQCPAILKVNAATIDIAHFHQFAIGGSETRTAAIACQQQFIAGSHLDLLAFMHRKGTRL